MAIRLVVAVLLASQPAREIVARVDGVAITGEALLRRVDDVRAQRIAASPELVLEGLVNEALLAAEGRRMGLSRERDVVERVEAEKRRAFGDLFVEKELATRVEIDEARLREMFHASSDFAWFESFTFETADAARAALPLLRTGPRFPAQAPGAVVAHTYPDASRAPAVMRAQIAPELAKALFAARPAEVVGPAKTDLGFVVARLLKKEVGAESTFAARRQSLARNAKRGAVAELREHVAKQLREKSRVELDEAFLRGLEGIAATPRQLDHVVATVGGTPVRYRDVHRSIRGLGASGGHMASPAVKIALAWQEIDERLLAGAAKERGYDKLPEALARASEIERAVLGAATLDRIRRSAGSPDDREIEDFYRRNAARFGKPFRQALPEAAAGAAAEKRERHAAARIGELRSKASVSLDGDAIARTVGPNS